jgi:hyperosmotically inducible protein
MKRRFGVLCVVLCAVLLLTGSNWILADTKVTDAQLQAMGQEKLSRIKPAGHMVLTVENAVATLEGSVDSVGIRNRAGKEVAKVHGITRVTNNLKVDVGGRGDDNILEVAAHQIRTYAFYTIFDNIELAADGGRLKLSGQVTQPWRRQDMENLVSMVSGVKEVENDIEVLPLSPFDEQIRLRVALAIYRDPILFRYGIRANPTIHIVVKNGDVTLTGLVGTSMDKVLAERAARFACTFFGLNNQLLVKTS